MTRLEILFADDQIPDENVTDNEIKTDELRRLRKTVELLQLAGYKVTTVKKHKEAMELIKRNHFDIAIIDLGWQTDLDLPKNEREFAGWAISEAIDKADKDLKSRQTFQVIYSRQFRYKPLISVLFANQGKLPLFKILDTDAGSHPLLAAIKFIEWHIWNPLKRIRQIMIRSWEEPLTQQRRWFTLTIIFVTLSIALLLVGISATIFLNVQVGTMAGISSIINSVISGLLYHQLKRREEVVEKSQNNIDEAYKNALNQFGLS